MLVPYLREARALGNANLVYPHTPVVLELLQTFCAVAELGSLTRAAEHLNLTQPAVTRQIRTLERQLGAVLVTRTSRGVALTTVGEAILPHARKVLSEVRAVKQAATEASTPEESQLRIAAGLMVTLYVLPPVVAQFRLKHPRVQVDLQHAHQRATIDRLLSYEADVVVIASPVRSPLVRAVPILHDPLLLVGPPDADDRPATLENLNGATLLVLPSDTGLHEQIETALHERAVTCQLVEYPTAETIKTAVALHMGRAILPASVVRGEVTAGQLSARPITDWPDAERIIHVLVRSEGRPPELVVSFMDVLRRHYGLESR